MADAKHAVQQNHSGSEMSSSSTNGDKVTPSDTNANHETSDKFIFSSTSMEFAVSRKVGKYRQKNSSDDITGHKQSADVRNTEMICSVCTVRVRCTRVYPTVCRLVLHHSRLYGDKLQSVSTTSGPYYPITWLHTRPNDVSLSLVQLKALPAALKLWGERV